MSRRDNTSSHRNLGLTVEDLKGKQSVRATFKLPQQVIDLLSVIAGQLGIKQKSLIDQLIEDASVLHQVADEAQNHLVESKNVRQKTFVISRSSLISLNGIAKQQKVPRDLLVEISIKRLLPLIESELLKHQKRKTLLQDMKVNLNHGINLLEKADELLGKDDFVYRLIENQVNLSKKNISSVNDIVERGMAMEDW